MSQVRSDVTAITPILMSDCQMDGREVWRLKLRKLLLWETYPSGGVINPGLVFDLTPLGLLSSVFVVPLIRLKLSGSRNRGTAHTVVQVYAHLENGHTNTSIHPNAFVTHSKIFCTTAKAVYPKK